MNIDNQINNLLETQIKIRADQEVNELVHRLENITFGIYYDKCKLALQSIDTEKTNHEYMTLKEKIRKRYEEACSLEENLTYLVEKEQFNTTLFKNQLK